MTTAHTHDDQRSDVRIRTTPFVGPIAWSQATLSPEDGLVRVTDACLEEIEKIVSTLRQNALPLELLAPEDFELRACRAMMRQVKHELDNGVGFVIIDRLPVGKYGTAEHKAFYWVLMQMLARPVAQDRHGNVIHDVRDFGQPEGNGVRSVRTNAGQLFHTDNNFNKCQPRYVALYCLQTAMEGGINSIVSVYTAHNEMLRRYPELLPRLYTPFLWDRQREHAPDEPMASSNPVFEYDGTRLLCRWSYRVMINGYKLAGEALDPMGKLALEAFESIVCEPAWKREFYFEPGQIQVIDNTRCAHRRTGFTDFPELERRRHLIRLWLRDEGRRFYNG